MAGKIFAVVGSMGSGKTESLINVYDNLKKGGKSVCVFKHKWDTRGGDKDKVISRNGRSVESTSVESVGEILDFEEDENKYLDAVLIDEIQLFNEEGISKKLTYITLLDIDVYVFGLDVTSDDKTFGTIGDILAHADHVLKLTGRCSNCGGESRVSHYVGSEEKRGDVKIGDIGDYTPLCRDCYYLGIKDLDYLDILDGIESKVQEEKYYTFEFQSPELSLQLVVTEDELNEVGYTLESVRDISELEGVENLLLDLDGKFSEG